MNPKRRDASAHTIMEEASARPGDGRRCPILVVMKGDAPRMRFTFDRPEIVVGRDEQCDIVLSDEKSSRRHAKFVHTNFEVSGEEPNVIVTDLKSTNGTFVNGIKISETRLRDQDEVSIGSTMFGYFLLDERDLRADETLTRLTRQVFSRAVEKASVHGSDIAREQSAASFVPTREARPDWSRYGNSETQILQTQKMEAIGKLAGGVAHDFNNLLTGILGYADMLKTEADPEGKVYRAADAIETAARRAAQLTQQLLGFARKGKMQNLPVDLHQVIDETISLLDRTFDKSIEILKRFNADPCRVNGDPNQLQQVVLNLAVNARDAMPDGGRLTFGSDVIDLGEDAGLSAGAVESGRYVMLTVTDTGCGIPEAIRERIFEPFFTTKAPGKGTGMGLAMVYGIVKNHEGFMQVMSERGFGTTFSVYLPLSLDETEAPSSTRTGAEGPIRGSGRILIVDDEEVVRRMTIDILESLGYEATAVNNGIEAVQYYERRAGEVDLALIDMAMPHMGGAECFRLMKKINPRVRAVVSTGYDVGGEVEALLAEGMVGYIQKPYRMKQLSEVVHQALTAGVPKAG